MMWSKLILWSRDMTTKLFATKKEVILTIPINDFRIKRIEYTEYDIVLYGRFTQPQVDGRTKAAPGKSTKEEGQKAQELR